MKKLQLLSRLISAGMMSLVIGAIATEVAQAQPTIYAFDILRGINGIIGPALKKLAPSAPSSTPTPSSEPQLVGNQPISILQLKCVQRWGELPKNRGADFSVNRQIFTGSIGWFPPASITCQLPGGPATLRIQYAVPDNSGQPPAIIEVYVDSNQVARQIGKDGQINTMMADVSNGKNISIDIRCARANECNNWYLFSAFHLIPGTTSEGR